MLRGYKLGQYLAPCMSSIEAEERLSFGSRLGMTLFAGGAQLYGHSGSGSAGRQTFPTWGVGFHVILKPAEHLLANVEYAHGVEDNQGAYLKFGYGW